MSTHKNLMTVCCAAVLAFGLAACGSSSDDNDMPPVTDNGMTPDPDDPMVSSLDGKRFPDGTMITLPAGLLDVVTANYKAMEGDTVEVLGVGTFECVTGPCTVDVANSVVTTTGVIEVVSLADLPDNVLALLEAEAEDAPVAPTLMEMAAAATKAAATKLEQIKEEAKQETDADAGLGGSDVDETDADQAYTVAIERNRMGTTVEIADPMMAGDDDDKFIMQEIDLSDFESNGFSSTMHLRDNGDGEEEVVIVSTDIEAPKATLFEKVKNPAGELTQVLNTNPETTDGDNQSLTIDGANVGMVGGVEDFPSATNQELVEFKQAAEFTGTFNGAPGTYTCDSADCTLSTNPMGELDAVGGTWYFTPDPDAKSYVADADYLTYGFWLKRTTDDMDETTYNEVETFAMSSRPASTGSDLDAVEGSASYEGGATGVYVKNVYDSGGGSIETATSGFFTADVSLMAYFGGGDVTANQEDTVTGTIDNFDLQYGEENSWSVALKSDPRAAGASTFSGAANGGGAEGKFSGTYHGPTPPTDDDADVNVAPAHVVGEFNANFSNGSVAGGFGAEKQ